VKDKFPNWFSLKIPAFIRIKRFKQEKWSCDVWYRGSDQHPIFSAENMQKKRLEHVD